MSTGEDSSDPQQALEAAEAAHLAARRAVAGGQVPDRPPSEESAAQPSTSTASSREPSGREQSVPEQPTVRLPPPPAEPPGRPGPAGRGAPLPLAALVASGWAAVVSFAPMALLVGLLAVLETGLRDALPAARVAAGGWLLAHGVPVQTPAGVVSIAPLALSALAAWRVSRAGVHVTRAIGRRGRRSPRQALLAAVAVATGYGAVGTLAALGAGGVGWGVAVPRAGLTLAGFGLLAGGYGAVRATGVLARWRAAVPPLLSGGVRAGFVATAGLVAAGAALAGGALAAGGGEAADILAAYGTDVAGQAGVTLVCLAYAPNLAGWAVAYLLGSGFAVGTDTVVRSSEVTTGGLPALPVFAGLPDGALPTVGALLLVVPVIAGALAGSRLIRSGRGWWRPGLAAVIAGTVAGALVGLVALGSGGGAGAGRLAEFGPDPVLAGLAAAGTVTAGALLGVAAAAVLAHRRRR